MSKLTREDIIKQIVEKIKKDCKVNLEKYSKFDSTIMDADFIFNIFICKKTLELFDEYENFDFGLSTINAIHKDELNEKLITVYKYSNKDLLVLLKSYYAMKFLLESMYKLNIIVDYTINYNIIDGIIIEKSFSEEEKAFADLGNIERVPLEKENVK